MLSKQKAELSNPLIHDTAVYTQPAPLAFANIGWRFYLIFVVVPLLGAPVLIWGMPETKSLSLEEIGVLFGDKVAAEVSIEEKCAIEHLEAAAKASRAHVEN